LQEVYDIHNPFPYKLDISNYYSKTVCLLNTSTFFKNNYVQNVKLLKDRIYDVVFIGRIDYCETYLTRFKKDVMKYIQQIGKKNNYKVLAKEHIKTKEYIKLLLESKIFISSYGWGEFSLKEYDCICTGTHIFKSDIYFSSFPNFYENMDTFKLDFSDLEQKIVCALNNINNTQEKVEKNRKMFCDFQKSNTQIKLLEKIL